MKISLNALGLALLVAITLVLGGTGSWAQGDGGPTQTCGLEVNAKCLI